MQRQNNSGTQCNGGGATALCNMRVKELCNKAATRVSHHGKCKGENAILFLGGDINIYLQSFGWGHDVDIENEITTVANAMDEDDMSKN